MKVNLVPAFLWRRPAFFLQKILLSRWYISWICHTYPSGFAGKILSIFVIAKKTFFLQLLDPFIDLICLQLLQGKELQILFFLELVYIYFFPYLTWIVISLFLSFFGLDCYFFIYFHIWFLLFLLHNSALFLLCLNTFSSSPQSLVIVHIRHHAFTLSIIKTTLFVLLLPNIFPLFDDDNQWFVTHQDSLLVIKTSILCHPSKLQTSCFLICQ